MNRLNSDKSLDAEPEARDTKTNWDLLGLLVSHAERATSPSGAFVGLLFRSGTGRGF